jgi:hypothetical protein
MKSFMLSRGVFFTLVLQVIVAPAIANAAIVTGPFGANGEGGLVNSQAFTFGTAGTVYELDAFINIEGRDLNGSGEGTSRQLSLGDPAPGINFTFSHEDAGGSDIGLTYVFTNSTGALVPGFKFMVLLDAEVGSELFTDEFGSVSGILGTGPGDSLPDSWEIDEPSFVSGDIWQHLNNGILDNTNAVPASSPEDVSIALGFDLGTLNPNDTAIVSLIVSDIGKSIPSLFVLKHHDTVLSDSLTLSGQAITPATLRAGLGVAGGLQSKDNIMPIKSISPSSETTRSFLDLWLGLGIGAFITVFVVVVLIFWFKRKKTKTGQPPRVY